MHRLGCDKKVKAYVILLNFIHWKDTIECLESVLKSDYEHFQIIVVDNDSPNNSMEKIIAWSKGELEACIPEDSKLIGLCKPFERKPLHYVLYSKKEALRGGTPEKEFEDSLILIQAGENFGFAAGNNIAIKFALARNDFDYVWLLNNDCVIKADSMTKLIEFGKESQCGICGSALYYYSTPEMIQALGGKINKLWGNGRHIRNVDSLQNEVDYVVGASFLISKSLLEAIGLLPEEYFLFYEDVAYCFSAIRKGFRIGVAEESIVYHKEGKTTGSSSDTNLISEFSDLLIIKNRIKFHKKFLGGGPKLYLGLFLQVIKRLLKGQLKRGYKIFRIVVEETLKK